MSLRCPKWAEKHRVQVPGYPLGDESNGCFEFKDKGLRVIIANGMGWEHVSVSRRSRNPTYDDMAWVASVFWDDEDTLMQLRVPVTDHVNNFEYCLHWWRPLEGEIPRPDFWMV